MPPDRSSLPPSSRPESSGPPSGKDDPDKGSVRLHKLLAHRGVASRRKAEQLVASGLVTVNGQVVTEPGSRVNPETDNVLVEGKPLRRESEPFLFLFYKPKGVVSTLHDPEGRPTLREFFPNIDPLLHVGRLDFQTEGALLLTNNGDLSQRILHPRYAIPRTYLVKIQGGISPSHAERIARGDIRLDGRSVIPMEFVPERDTDSNAWYRITLTEGRNREVRRLFETLNYFVLKLVRTAFGPLTLAGLDPGEYRPVTPAEIRSLLAGETPTHLPRSLDSRHRPTSGEEMRGPRRSFRERDEPRKSHAAAAPFRSRPGEDRTARPERPEKRFSDRADNSAETIPARPPSPRKTFRSEAPDRPQKRSAPFRSRPGEDRTNRPERPKKRFSDRADNSAETIPARPPSPRKTFRDEAPDRPERPKKRFSDRTGNSAETIPARPPSPRKTFRDEAPDRPQKRSAPFRSRPGEDRPARPERPKKRFSDRTDSSAERSPARPPSPRKTFRGEAQNRPPKRSGEDSAPDAERHFRPQKPFRGQTPSQREKGRSSSGQGEWKEKRPPGKTSGFAKTGKRPGPGGRSGPKSPPRSPRS